MPRNEALVKARREKNLSQEKVSRALNISNRFYQLIESGRSLPNINTALALAQLLDRDPRELFK